MTTFYSIDAGAKPWGDFSDMLANGFIYTYETYEEEREKAFENYYSNGGGSKDDMELWLLREDIPVYPPDQLLLLRTGPFYYDFVPRMKYCSEAGKKWLEEFCPDLIFTHLIKFHIPELHWEEWDKTKDEPEQYPIGEVEGYVFNELHSQECADSMPEFYEVWTRVCLDEYEVEEMLKANKDRFFLFRLRHRFNQYINQKGMEMLLESSWNIENLEFRPLDISDF